MPVNKKLYPKNWDAIATDVKTSANWQCQSCQKFCRKPKEPLLTFIKRAFNLSSDEWHEAFNYPQRFTLTCAHYPDSNPSNCSLSNLIALCSVCHLRLDTKLHVENRKRNKLKKQKLEQKLAGQQNLPLEVPH